MNPDDLVERAGRGDTSAQFNLGVIYEHGEGVDKDERTAFEWYARAAAQGNAEAQCCMALLCQDGRGVPQDERKAVAWLQRAADQGWADALFNLGKAHDDGRGVPQDKIKALSFYEKAGLQGHLRAQCLLGLIYSLGKRVPKDDMRAYLWYGVAATLGDDYARVACARMERRLPLSTRNEAKEYAWPILTALMPLRDTPPQTNARTMEHNPDNLTDQVVDVASDYRLLTQAEVLSPGRELEAIEFWLGDHWEAKSYGDSLEVTYRTKLSPMALSCAREGMSLPTASCHPEPREPSKFLLSMSPQPTPEQTQEFETALEIGEVLTSTLGTPDSPLIRVNPQSLKEAIGIYTTLGGKKPFFQRGEQFVMNSLMYSAETFAACSHRIVLCHYLSGREVVYWYGNGNLKRKEPLDNVRYFSGENRFMIASILLNNAIYTRIQPFLTAQR